MSKNWLAVGFFALMFVGFGVALLFPEIRHGELSRGLLGALNVPTWMLLATGMVLSAACVVIGTWSHFRIKNGRPPL